METPTETFNYGSLLFRRFWDGWHITGPSEDLEKYAEALENDVRKEPKMEMKLLVAITLTDEQRQKIAWDCCQYTLLPDEDACKMWLEDQLQTVFADLPMPPEELRIREEPK